VWGLKDVDFRAKRATFAALKKVRSFVFKYFLAWFPLFFIFLAPWASAIVPITRFSFAVRQRRRPATTECP
jgi:hypothetical protein